MFYTSQYKRSISNEVRKRDVQSEFGRAISREIQLLLRNVFQVAKTDGETDKIDSNARDAQISWLNFGPK